MRVTVTTNGGCLGRLINTILALFVAAVLLYTGLMPLYVGKYGTQITASITGTSSETEYADENSIQGDNVVLKKSYSFTVNGEEYAGRTEFKERYENSATEWQMQEKYKNMKTVEVKYLPEYPRINYALRDCEGKLPQIKCIGFSAVAFIIVFMFCVVPIFTKNNRRR